MAIRPHSHPQSDTKTTEKQRNTTVPTSACINQPFLMALLKRVPRKSRLFIATVEIRRLRDLHIDEHVSRQGL